MGKLKSVVLLCALYMLSACGSPNHENIKAIPDADSAALDTMASDEFLTQQVVTTDAYKAELVVLSADKLQVVNSLVDLKDSDGEACTFIQTATDNAELMDNQVLTVISASKTENVTTISFKESTASIACVTQDPDYNITWSYVIHKLGKEVFIKAAAPTKQLSPVQDEDSAKCSPLLVEALVKTRATNAVYSMAWIEFARAALSTSDEEKQQTIKNYISTARDKSIQCENIKRFLSDDFKTCGAFNKITEYNISKNTILNEIQDCNFTKTAIHKGVYQLAIDGVELSSVILNF